MRELIEAPTVEGLRAFLAESPAIASKQFADGSWPLHFAAGNNNPDAIELLIRAGASKHPKYAKSAHTALSWAVTCWSFGAALKLIELGEEPDLFCASGLGLIDKVRAFWPNEKLRAHPSRTGSSRFPDTGERLCCPPENDQDQVSDALYIACRCGQREVSRFLLEHGADPNFRGYSGATCLAWAEFSGDPNLPVLLRQYGASDEILDQSYKSKPKVFALMLPAGWGFPLAHLRKRLDANPELVHTRSEWGTLPHAAAQGGGPDRPKLQRPNRRRSRP